MDSSHHSPIQLRGHSLEHAHVESSIHRSGPTADALLPLNIIAVPFNVLKLILRLLLVGSNALPLDSHPGESEQKISISIQANILRVCRLFYLTSLPILYGENTITTSQSYNFDTQLLTLPPRNRQMITNVRLEIDWANHLWAKFPLIAMQLCQLRKLQRLEVIIVETKEPGRRAASLDKDPNHTMIVGCCHVKGTKREGSLAAAMLKAEKKMLKEMVGGLKALRTFRLEGFRDALFAERLCFERPMVYK